MKSLQDASLILTQALPNGAATVTTSPAMDLQISAGSAGAGVLGEFEGTPDFLLSAPALSTGQLGNAATMTYNIVYADSADLQTNPVTYIAAALVQTGAGGVGAAAATFRFKLPTTTKRYVGFTAVNSAAGNASTVNATLAMLI